MNTFKIMTYNIHYGIGKDRQYNIDRIIEVIASENPDVVTLQEVDNKVVRTRCDNQPRLIAEALCMDYYYCVNCFIGDGEFGIATLSRFPFTHIERFDLSYRRRLEPRGTLRTDIQLDQENNIHVFNVHFGLRPWERHFQRRCLFSDEILLHEIDSYRLKSPLASQASDHIPVITRIALDQKGGKQCGI